jgi:hypothetical protein
MSEFAPHSLAITRFEIPGLLIELVGRGGMGSPGAVHSNQLPANQAVVTDRTWVW